jgi:hypothetical protein
MSDNLNARVFSGGSWDLRKIERRLQQTAIDFSERRAIERRESFERMMENEELKKSKF